MVRCGASGLRLVVLLVVAAAAFLLAEQGGVRGVLAKRSSSSSNDKVQVVVLEKPEQCDRVAEKGDTVYIRYSVDIEEFPAYHISNEDSLVPEKMRLGVFSGADQYCKGFHMGLKGACVGEKRRVLVPPKYGYGKKGEGDVPPNATLALSFAIAYELYGGVSAFSHAQLSIVGCKRTARVRAHARAHERAFVPPQNTVSPLRVATRRLGQVALGAGRARHGRRKYLLRSSRHAHARRCDGRARQAL